ncbi:MAG: NAD-dependent epimerase/dehydratase [Ignavibacteria bacterium]|jgi:nucleoside-diphosphate-sugar epimerase|nr:NAD-dependent epimerase/dehydratase [Ignavibacteria bacterium]MDH7527486.1 NAD-dependent epimerase/dehydratase [Ignavibacteria bacterium]
MKRIVLITGINGFLGSHLAKKLKSDYEVLGLEIDLKNLFRLSGESFKVYSVNNHNLDDLFKNNRIFSVVHTATVYNRIDNDVIPIIDTNIKLPITLYQLSVKYKVKLFINTDSFFNDTRYYSYNYQKEYTLSKKQILEWLKIMQDKTKIVNMKLFHMFGPYDNPNKFIPQLLIRLKKGEKKIDLTLGEQKRDFIYIDDVTSAFKTILDNYYKIEENFISFDVGTGKSVMLKKFIIELKKLLKSTSKLNFGAIPYRENEIMFSKSNIKDLKSLGWKPQYNYKTGLKKLVESYR